MRIAPHISTSKCGTKWKTRNVRPVLFRYGGYKNAMSHSKHILPYRNLTFISCTPSLVIRVSSSEIFIGISGLQEMLLSKLKLSLVYVYILLFFPHKFKDGTQSTNIVSVCSSFRSKLVLWSTLNCDNKFNSVSILVRNWDTPNFQDAQNMRDFRLPPRCKWGLRSFGILRSVQWKFLPEVSGTIGPIFKGQAALD